jgi:DNA-directed RNA polymerase subunit beta'
LWVVLIPAGTGLAYHEARKVRENMDDAERRAIAEAEAAELAGDTALVGEPGADEGGAAE